MRRTCLLCALTPLIALVIAGCAKPDARSVAAQYVGYMKNGKFKAAALLWDYGTEARQQNESWDDIPEGQRQLIIGKLADEKATTLAMWSSYFPASTKVAQVSESGDTAQAVLAGGRIESLQLVKSGDTWGVSGMN